MAKDKKKKEKIIYYDDGSTVADMSNISPKPTKSPMEETPAYGIKAKLQTFFGAMRLMVMPMLTVVLGIGLIYAIIYLLFNLFR